MKRVYRRIAVGAVMFGCAAFAMYGITGVMERSEAVPAAVTGMESEKPVIILDAGHGGIDGGCVSAEGVPEKGMGGFEKIIKYVMSEESSVDIDNMLDWYFCETLIEHQEK